MQQSPSSPSSMTQNIQKITIAGMLIALGILIPMFSPIRVVIEPASFTLASHVVIFIAMFISPPVAVAVSLGTTLGFFVGGFPPVIVMRALTHVVWACIGSVYIMNMRAKGKDFTHLSLRVFSFIMGVFHALLEVVIVSIFYFNGMLSPANMESGFVTAVLLLVGVGTVIHSMVDLEIANLVMLGLKKNRSLAPLFGIKAKAAPAVQANL